MNPLTVIWGEDHMRFQKLKEDNPDDRWDARQRLITGWDADAIRNSTILVLGGGAIGNETLKNMALLGFGHIIVCDMDKIETSNLTRTVLFTPQDVEKEKAPLAAQRFLEMNLEPTATADSFTGDIVYELGDGVFRRADIVLGCLDNMETRMYANKICMRYDLPFVDAGINALGCNLSIMKGHAYGCYACFANESKFQERFRQSCDLLKRKVAKEGKAATVQCTSAIIAGMQVQEALKILCNMNPQYGTEMYFQGTLNQFSKFHSSIDPDCVHHSIPARTDVKETPLSCHNTLREFLDYSGGQGYPVLSVADDKLRNFVSWASCPGCGKKVRIYQPLFKVHTDDLYCPRCREANVGENYLNFVDDISLLNFSLADTPADILDLTLKELGIPPFHVLCVQSADGEQSAFLELTRDAAEVLPAYAAKHNMI